MLADRPRTRWAIEICALLAVVSGAVWASRRVETSFSTETPADPVPFQRTHLCTGPTRPLLVDPAPAVRETEQPAMIVATLRFSPERTTKVIDSDWHRRYRGEGEGPIETWTRMRNVNVPSLNDRLFEEVRPFLLVGDGFDLSRAVLIEVRAVVPGDAEAALERVRANPDVDHADVWTVQGHRGEAPSVEYD